MRHANRITDQEPVVSDLERTLLDGVDVIMGPSGLMTEDGYRYSKHQHDYARRATRGLARYDAEGGRTAVNMLQAATGTGKTFGYLVPLLLYATYTGRRVAVSTYTKHLQRQILDKDAPTAKKWVEIVTEKTLSTCLRVGISSYASIGAADNLRDALARDDAERFADAIDLLDDLADWLKEEDEKGVRVHSGIIADFLAEHGVDPIPQGFVPARLALKHGDPADERRAYLQMVDASKAADVLIINHALLAMNAYRFCAILDTEDRPIAALVCDEADRLADAAESVIGAGLALHSFRTACEAMDVPEVTKAATAIVDYVNTLSRPGVSAVRVDDRAALAGKARSSLDVLKVAARSAERGLPKGGSAKAAADSWAGSAQDFIDAVRDLEEVAANLDDPHHSVIVSWSPVRAFPTLRIGRPEAGRILSRLWSARPKCGQDRGYLDAVLFTSATLDTPGRDLPQAFDAFASSIGVVRHPRKPAEADDRTPGGTVPIHNVCPDLYARFEPTRFGEMRFVLADPQAPSPSLKIEDAWSTNPQWIEYCASMIRAAHSAGGRTLALTLSWRDNAALAKRLADLDSAVIEHRKGQPLAEAVDQYRRTDRAVLLSPSAWEGLDLPGLVQQLVFTRIPFSPLDSDASSLLRLSLEKRYSHDMIDNILHNRMMVGALRKAEQGIGRGLRSASDQVTLWVADPRWPMPESFGHSLDAKIAPGPHKSYSAFRYCIPERFREDTYQHASVWLQEGALYTPKSDNDEEEEEVL